MRFAQNRRVVGGGEVVYAVEENGRNVKVLEDESATGRNDILLVLFFGSSTFIYSFV